LMYYTEKAYDTGKPIFVEKDKRKKEKQKNIILKKRSGKHVRNISSRHP
jgi:hypothetical protein